MGKYLNQCADDAWEIIRGRKIIVGNNIIEVDDWAEDEVLKENVSEYGWLAPDGTFYPVGFSKHQSWAEKYIRELYQKGNISIEEFRKSGSCYDAGDWLVDHGWVLIHNPQQSSFKITRNSTSRLAKKQKEFLYDYFCKHKRNNEIEKLLTDEL